MYSDEKAKQISNCLQLAILLEASANKPGNVGRTSGFEHTRYEHFLASAVAVTSSFEIGARHGIAVSKREMESGDVALGWIIKNCVADVNDWQRGGNTLLGTIILLSPIAVAAGMTPSRKAVFDMKALRENLKIVVDSTTPEDAVNVYEAIGSANPGGLGKSPELDVNDPNSASRIVKDRISLYHIFKIASTYDSICSEWVKNYPVTFDIAYPYLMKQLKEKEDLNSAIINAFLRVLAEYPDTLIARKTSFGKAREVSFMSQEILKLGGPESPEGREKLRAFDMKLRESANLLNPGTTADIISAGLTLSILSGYRP